MLEALNIDEAFKAVDGWLEGCSVGAESAARNIAVDALITLADRSPQYSGDFVANWRMSLNTPDLTFKEGLFPDKKYKAKDPFIRGDQKAQDYAFTEAVGKLDNFKLGDTIYLSNSAAHTNKKGGKEHYAWEIEKNKIKFRIGNFGNTIADTVDILMLDYRKVSKATFEGWLSASTDLNRSAGT